MTITRKLFVFMAVALLFGASATLAGPGKRMDKGASGNGVFDTFDNCKSPAETSACGNFSPNPIGTLDGADVFQFVTNDGVGDISLVDVFQIPGTVTPGSTLTLNLADINVGFGDFACNNGQNGAESADPTPVPLKGPCTIGNISDLADLFTESDNLATNTATFNFISGANFPSAWAFYYEPGNLTSFLFTPGTTSTTPEPGSASLLLAGALAAGLIALKARR